MSRIDPRVRPAFAAALMLVLLLCRGALAQTTQPVRVQFAFDDRIAGAQQSKQAATPLVEAALAPVIDDRLQLWSFVPNGPVMDPSATRLQLTLKHGPALDWFLAVRLFHGGLSRDLATWPIYGPGDYESETGSTKDPPIGDWPVILPRKVDALLEGLQKHHEACNGIKVVPLGIGAQLLGTTPPRLVLPMNLQRCKQIQDADFTLRCRDGQQGLVTLTLKGLAKEEEAGNPPMRGLLAEARDGLSQLLSGALTFQEFMLKNFGDSGTSNGSGIPPMQ
jgi:hypothetical protein